LQLITALRLQHYGLTICSNGLYYRNTNHWGVVVSDEAIQTCVWLALTGTATPAPSGHWAG